MDAIITRENNKYNKYLKWHLIIKFDTGGSSSDWFKTRKEAEYSRDRSLKIMQEGKYTTVLK